MNLLKSIVCLFICGFGLTLFSFPLCADDDVDFSDFGSENIKEPAKKPTPFFVTVRVDNIEKAEIEEGFFKKDEVRFTESEGELGLIYYYCPAYKEGATVSLGYTSTLIDWEHNPWFEQRHFNTFSINFGAFTGRINRWFWRGQLTINTDANEWNISEYGFYDILLWGRYEYCRDIGIHVGFIAQTGMRMDRVYPIIGADWQVSKDWKINLVYPVNVSLEYILTKKWTLALAGRNFDFRHRVRRDDSHPKALVRYQNVGAEFAVKFEDAAIEGNVHVGTTLGGKLRIANQHNNHPHHYKLSPSLYWGAEATVRF